MPTYVGKNQDLVNMSKVSPLLVFHFSSHDGFLHFSVLADGGVGGSMAHFDSAEEMPDTVGS